MSKVVGVYGQFGNSIFQLSAGIKLYGTDIKLNPYNSRKLNYLSNFYNNNIFFKRHFCFGKHTTKLIQQQLYEFAKLEFPNFELCRVRGHVGIAGNELADALATHDDNKFVKVLQKHNIKTREEVKFDFQKKI